MITAKRLSDLLLVQVLLLVWPVVYFWQWPGDALARGQYDRPEIFVFDLGLSLALYFGLRLWPAGRPEPLRRSIYWLAWLLLLTSALGVYTAADKLIVLVTTIRFFAAAAWYWLLVNFLDRRRLVLALVAAAAVAAAMAVGQFLWQAVPAAKWLGWSAQQPSALGVSVVESGPERWLRAYGPFPHPNILGGFLALALLSALALLAERLPGDKRLAWLLYALPLLVAGLLLSFSRAAALALLAGIACQLLFSRGLWRRQWLLLSVLLLSALPWWLLFGQLVFGRADLSARLERQSLDQRRQYLVQAQQLLAARPLLGWGAGNYTAALKQLQPAQPQYAYQPVHNIFILARVELGYLGWLVLAGLWLSCAYYSWRRPSALPLNASLLIALSILAMSDHWLWSLHGGLMVFWLTLAIITLNLPGRQAA